MSLVRFLRVTTVTAAVSVVVAGLAGWSNAASAAPSSPAGQWQLLSANPLPFFPQAAMVLTDGSVMLQEVTSDEWWRLRPGANGSYLDGTYTETPPMPDGYAPTYPCRAVLPDGRMLIIGGEYQGTNPTPVESNQGAVYDPVANTWQPVAPPAGVAHIGDSSCTLMPNGQLLLASRTGGNVFDLDPATMTWTALTPTGKLNGRNAEENWTLLPDGTIFTVDVIHPGNGERYIPPWLDHSTNGQWIPAGVVPGQLETATEMGPAVLRPDGSVFVAGATGQNAVYHPPATLYGTGTWEAAQPFTDSGTTYAMADGTASLLPNGNLVALASPGVYQRPTKEFLISGTNTAPLDPQLPDSVNSQISSYSPDSVLLPTGQVLVTLIGGGEEPLVPPYVFTPAGVADPSWRPTISTHDSRRVLVDRGKTITVTGTQLSGLSQGSNYGDDGDSATNFPVVRIVNQRTHRVEYARTFGFSDAVVAGLGSTSVALPADLDTGPADLVVIANGIASAPLKVLVS
ncbi:MAG TPA: hypothetical protein VH373_23365 [Jatrophihabitantaceae bacterium]